MARTSFSGPVRSAQEETDGEIFIPATLEYSYGGTWTKTRTAAGDYNLLKTAAADTTQSVFNLSAALFKKIGADPNLGGTSPGLTTRSDGAARYRGARLTSVWVAWKNTTSDLTSGTVDLHRSTMVNGGAAGPTILSTVGGTLTGAALTVTASANMRLEQVTLGTPYILGNNLTAVTDWCEIAWIAAAGSVVTVYGIFAAFDYNIN